jgi:formylglycine-generating enzyme required for sulfatase activity
LEQDAPPLHSAAPGVDARFAAAVDRCLRRDPTERFASADELLEVLEALRARHTVTHVPEGNPYRGLQAFQEEHRALFFGRGREIRAVLERMRSTPFILITGDSGVGKSSLCLAGVLPRVTEGALEDGRRWRVARLVPGRAPLASAAAALAPHLKMAEAEAELLLRTEPSTLVRALRVTLGSELGVVLHVDQLEELVTVSEPQEAALVSELLGQLASGVAGVRLLATVRSDFLTRVGALPWLGDSLSRTLHLLRPLSRAEVREVITGPAQVKGVRFESEALITTLVESTVRAEGSLPLLQFTLAELWETRDRERGIITASALEALGGVGGALAWYADSVLDQLPPEQQLAARRLLMRLVTGEGTRARRSGPELLDPQEGSHEALEALIRARLVVVHESGAGATFDIAHEALLTGWARLAGWLAEATETRQLLARLELAAAEWERLERPREALWGERHLEEARTLESSHLAVREAAFLEASRRALRRAKRRTRVLTLGFLASLVLVYGGLRLHGWYTLERQVGGQLVRAEALREQARERQRQQEQVRAEAFDLFDSARLEEARSRWAQALQLRSEVEHAYSLASDLLETTLVLTPGREEVRRAFVDILSERAGLAERAFRARERDELLHRLQLYDTGGEYQARWTAPMRLSVHSSPPGATVSLAHYTTTADGRRVLSSLREVGRTPLETLELARGSHVLLLEAPGHAPVRYPLRAEPGARRTLELTLPLASHLPPGFIYVPPGRFLFGTAADESIRQFFSAVPLHEVETGPYLIARHEVTYGEYMAWLETLSPEERARHSPHGARAASVNAEVELKRLPEGRWRFRFQPNTVAYEANEGEPIRYTSRSHNVEQDWRRLPVGSIDYEDVRAYAAWLSRTGRVPGARLCTELEWERAARGADDREYPHGDVLRPQDANFDETYGKVGPSFGPDEVGRHPESRSPFGLEDMAGNVFEWADSALEPGRPVARGGSYYYAATTSRSTNRETPEPNFRDPSVGARLCAEAPSSR